MKCCTAMLVAAAMAQVTFGATIFFSNKCDHKIELWDNHNGVPMDAGANHATFLPVGFTGRFQAGRDPRATLAEFSNDGKMVWYDISIIPTGPGQCRSLEECKRVSGGNGYNVPMQMAPRSNIGVGSCKTVTCMADGCQEGYKFPKDDINTHSCPVATDFDVTFCPGGPGGTTQPPTTTTPPQTTTPPPTTTTPPPTPNTTEPVTTPPPKFHDGSATTEDAVLYATPHVANAASASNETAAPSTTTPPTATGPVEEVKTQTSGGGGSGWTSVVAVLLPVAAAAGVAAIFVAHRKKAQLDELDDKSTSPMSVVGHTSLNSAVL